MITPALKLWRETVSGCRTPAQLYMCLTLLNDCIAWDKSIMKVVSLYLALAVVRTLVFVYIFDHVTITRAAEGESGEFGDSFVSAALYTL